MKFTNGYWSIRKEYQASYAVEYWDHQVKNNELIVYVATNHIESRGDILNKAMLTVTLSSPMPDIIKVSIVHFAGSPNKKPEISKAQINGDFVDISEDEKHIYYRSGESEAVIHKSPNAWAITYKHKGKLLTETGYRNQAYMHNIVNGKNYMLEQLLLDVGENIYGLGERYTPFVKNGQEVQIWNEDGGTASEQSYKNIPFYVSSKGYGVFVDSLGDVQFEIGSEKVERVQFSMETECLDYYLICKETPKETVSLYTDLVGKPALPPAWTFGLWLTTSFTTSYDEKTVTGFIDGMKERRIPLHVFHFDCFWMKGYEWVNFTWDDETFPDPEGMLKRYKERGLHICCWINSYVAQKSPMFEEGMKNGYFVKRKDGSVWQWDLWQAGMALVDFTNPEACKWYSKKLEKLLDMGVDCFKTDFGERIPVSEIEYYDHSDPVRMHNYYTYLYNKLVFELLERKRGKKEACLFARSATVGGQKFPVHWGGDSTATYPSMAEELRGGLSLSTSGFGYWSHDIGGFENTASADVYKRWCQFGLLSSHSRLHGSDSYRVPWIFDEEACAVLEKFVRLKCSLMPYLYGQAVKAHEEGIPMMRPMFMEYPEDETCLYLDRQYMLGDSILVAPIFHESGEVSYYLPKGKWTNYLTNEVKEGERWYKETFDYYHLPIMIRENTILPVGKDEEVPDYDYLKDTQLKIYQPILNKQVEIMIPDVKGNKKVGVCMNSHTEHIDLTLDGGEGFVAICVGDEKKLIKIKQINK
ncbi:MAG TPA: alpha-xylosidase [Lachnospiraceae bacterium]